jgi:predicted nucleic acid-binding protein
VRDLKSELDAGEAEAIALAEELSADYLLIDEKRGRTIAAGRGLRIIGVLGILVRAKGIKLIPNVKTVLQRLKTEAGVWIEKSLEESVLKQVGEA